MDPSQDGGLPPVGGLGNFKGVMLCNRPADAPSSGLLGGECGDGGPQPFKSTISATHGEAIGLTPCKKIERSEEVKARGPSAALRRHVRWLKELQTQMKEERNQVEDWAIEADIKKVKVQAFYEKQRDTVRQMMNDREQPEPCQADLAEKARARRAQVQEQKKKKAAAKPLWAMTPKEKEMFEEKNDDDMVDFAANLDFEKYIGDLEFKEALAAMRDRAGRIQKEQDAFKDALVQEFNAKAEDDEEDSVAAGSALEDGIDGQSVLESVYSEGGTRIAGRSRAQERKNADGRPEWDGSTACGDERPAVDADTKAAADRVLESNPQIGKVHSKGSVQKIIEKARASEEGSRQGTP